MKLKIAISLVIMALLVGCRVKEQGESIDLTVWVTDWDLSRGQFSILVFILMNMMNSL